MATTTVRLPDQLDAALSDLAKRQHRSKHAAMLALIADGIERAEQADAEHNQRLFAEVHVLGGGATISGEQVAADYAAVRAERDAELLGDL